MQVTKEGIERIKSANELAAVVAERGVELRKKGRQLVAACPFHKEKTASFNVSLAKGLYHCFGCGASGDVIGFVTKHDKVSFGGALETLARRAGLDLGRLMEERPRIQQRTPLAALTPPGNGKVALATKPATEGAPPHGAPATAILSRVVEHYHRSFCEREDAQAYLAKRGLTDRDLLRALKIGYADGSLIKTIPKSGEVWDELQRLGVITPEGRELLGGCVVVPIPDPVTGQWTNLYGRGMKTPRHCYLPGPLRGVLNFQAARLSQEVVLAESVLDALSFHQAGIGVAIPIYGMNGFTPDHLDLLKREGVERVVLALDNDDAGRKGTDALKGKLEAAGLAVRSVSFPVGVKDANELLVSRNGDAGQVFRQLLDAATSTTPELAPSPEPVPTSPLREKEEKAPAGLQLTRDGVTYQTRVHSLVLGRLRVTVKATKGDGFHVDTIDLYASRSRAEFSKRAAKALGVQSDAVEAALLALLVEAEKATDEAKPEDETSAPVMSEAERAEALTFLKRADLLGQVALDIDALGYVGEETNKRLLYLVAVSRKLDDPLSAIVLSQSGAGQERPHRGDRAALPAGRRRPPDAAHAPEPLLHRARIPRPQARDRRGASRLARSGLLDPGAAEPEEADRGGACEGPADREHADQALHGRGASGLHRSDDGSECQPRERDALLRAADGRDRGADAADPRASEAAADRARPRAQAAGRGDHAAALERAASPRAAAGHHPLRRSAELPLELDAHAARPRPLLEPDRGVGLPSPAPA